MAHGQRAAYKAKHSACDYWSRRYGNDSKANPLPARAKHDPKSAKRMTRRAERHIAKHADGLVVMQ